MACQIDGNNLIFFREMGYLCIPDSLAVSPPMDKNKSWLAVSLDIETDIDTVS
jgi:hypothetical protein